MITNSNWQYCLLSDVARIVDSLHKTPQYTEKGIPMVRVTDIKGGFICLDQTVKVDKETFRMFTKNHAPEKDNILISRVGSYGLFSYVNTDQKFCLGQNTAIIVSKINPRFLYYSLISQSTQNYIERIVTGSTQKTISLKDIKAIPIALPPVDIQNVIAVILSSIDDKIAINNRINDNLLKQARTVFQSWFVDFDPFEEPMVLSPAGYEVPQSLRMIRIQELPHILETGKRPKGGAVSDGIPSIGAENVKALGSFDASSAKYIPYDFAASMKRGKIEGYELLLYKDGGKPGTFTPHFSMFGEGFPYDTFYINEHVFKLDFYDHGFNEFAYFYMHTDYPYHWLANNGGKAAIPGINQQDVNSLWIYHPEHPKVQEFCHWVQPLFVEVFSNCAQNMKLAKVRDTLLPRLMSGEIDVSDIAV